MTRTRTRIQNAAHRRAVTEYLAEVAADHADRLGHIVHLTEGEGWACETCDPDICEVTAS